MRKREIEFRRRIVEALNTHPSDWHYGYDIMKTCHMYSGRFYTTIDKMESENLIESKWDNDYKEPPRRRVYRLVKS